MAEVVRTAADINNTFIAAGRPALSDERAQIVANFFTAFTNPDAWASPLGDARHDRGVYDFQAYRQAEREAASLTKQVAA